MTSKLLNYPSASSTTSTHSRFVNNSSAAVASSAIASSCSLNFENLQLDDILCPVCASVLVEPVNLPCQHLFCRNCLSETIEKNKLNCPCCRKRFGTWYRNASRVNKLVHERLWQAIQNQFRDRLAEDSVLGTSKEPTNGTNLSKQNITLATPGAIRQEFTNELKRFQKERFEEATKELAATEQCILNLYKQEGIIDLGDNSSHVSVSSTTTPDNDAAGFDKTVTVSTSSAMAGPSSMCNNTRQQVPQKGRSWNQALTGEEQKPVVPVGSIFSKSPSNSSIISISSTSSAQSALTASSAASSSASERYSLLKCVVQQVGRSAELVKQKVQGSILHRLTVGKVQQHQKTLSSFDLNKSEHCVKPTELHKIERRGIKDEDSSDDGAINDTDSLKSEQNHFIPIIASLPRSCFSLDRVFHATPIRPAVSPLKYHYTPKKSPYRPLKLAISHKSAFSVVNLFTPPKMSSPLGSDKASTKSTKRNDKAATSAPRPRGRPRGVKLKFSPPARGRKTGTVKNSNPGCSTTCVRTTRRTAEINAIRELIISDQQRREQQIAMERRDFEFAQRLQEKLNRTGGIMQEIHRQYTAPRDIRYSLRRKGPAEDTPDSTINKNGTTSLPVERASFQKTSPAKKSRKRKATSSSVENDVPSSSSPAKQTAADHSARRQTRQNRSKPKQCNVSLPAATAPSAVAGCPSTTVEQQSIPQRKSTRNKTR